MKQTRKRFPLSANLDSRQKDNLTRNLMLFPSVIALVGIMIPFAIGVFTSMTDRKLYESSFRFVFLQNYFSNFDNDTFLISLANTLAYTVCAMALQLLAGTLVVALLDIRSRLQTFMRTVVIFPLLIPPIVSSLMWKTMLQPSSGVINYLLSRIGIAPGTWLTGLSTALPTLILMDTWVYLPFTSIILLAGVQSLPEEIIESGRIDGATGIQQFLYLKLPWMRKYFILTMLFRICDSLKAFELIYSTTKGGPMNATRTLNILAYEEAFRWSNIGTAQSVIFTLWILAFIVSSFLLKLWNMQAEEL